mgnify:CR=1 FL=1
MNLIQMRHLLRRRCGSPSTSDVTETDLNGHLNNAIEEILDKFPFLQGRKRERFSTQANASKYHIDSQTHTVLKVWDRTNDTRLRKIGPSTVAETDFDDAVTGKPTDYARFSRYMQLFPTPDGVYTIEFLCRLIFTPLINDGDFPPMPPTWHRGVCIYATYMYYSDQGKDPQKATFSFNEFLAWSKTKPVEMQDELTDMDQGVELPTLGGGSAQRLDFDHSA